MNEYVVLDASTGDVPDSVPFEASVTPVGSEPEYKA
jgi:hypothetical protein